MKKIILKLLIIIFTFNIVITNSAIAGLSPENNTKVTIDLKQFDNITRNKIIDTIKVTEEEQVPKEIVNMDNAKKFAEYGKSVAIALQEVCKVLNVEVNAFVKTPVGNTVMWLIIYHVIGKDLLKITLAFFIWFLITIILIFTFTRFHLPYKVKIIQPVLDNRGKSINEVVKNNEGGETLVEKKEIAIKYIQKYHWKDETAKCFSAAAHVCVFMAATITLIVKVI